WTTDQQLIQTIRSVGVYDVVELKFAENRANGQSKGYAEVVVASENSVHKLLELLPGKVLNGDKVEVRLATRQNLSQFEAQARKRGPGLAPQRCDGIRRDCPGRSVRGGLCRSQGMFGARKAPPLPSEFWWRVPGGSGKLLPSPPPSLFGQSKASCPSRNAEFPFLSRVPPRLGLPKSTRGSGSPALWGSLPAPSDTYGKAMAPYNHSSRELGPPPPAVSEGEFEEIMNRNRAISSSAISKAVSGASAGDYSNAIETLLTAIAVIKQSRVAGDERCRVLLSSLKDCLHGIEAKSYSSSSSSSSRKRHRSRERSPSRSRESSRRHRDLLHSDERHEEYFPERSREHERHRDRDRDRDR
ncbi:CPSF7 factor, partial [Scytalopus superciliaris]|nr:CPSF7 factor [Scytalopus superciliaris]